MAVLERKNRGSSHSYTIDGEWVPGVTTVIGVLDKPALVGWAARETAAYADDNMERLINMRSSDRLKEMEGARFSMNRKAVTRGHRIHAMADQVAHGAPLTDIPADILPAVEAIAEMMRLHEMETIATEVSLGSSTYGYAGTADAIVQHPRWGNLLIDYKTGKGVYSEVALQLAAYRHCDLALVPTTQVGPRGGVKTVHVQQGMPPVDHCMAVHVHTTDVELVPVKAGLDQFAAFLACLDVFNGWILRTGWDYRDREDRDYPIGAPLGGPESLIEEGF